MILSDYKKKLESLLDKKIIDEEKFRHFLDRGVQIISFKGKFHTLDRYLPDGIVIGASKQYINHLKIPYQETSFMVANSVPEGRGVYIFKTFGKGGGVENLAGGTRPLGDNIFASLNRITIGKYANMVSAKNFVDNKDEIYGWHYFGDNLREQDENLYDDLASFAKFMNVPEYPVHIVIARDKSTFERLKIIELYNKNRIASLETKNQTQVIFLTNDQGYQYASKFIKPDDDFVHYIHKTKTSGEIDIIDCLKELRSTFGIKHLLNDGGRKMALSMIQMGIVGGERITYEPFPGNKFLPKNIDDDSVLGKDGIGFDGCEIENSFVIYTHQIKYKSNLEKMKLHLYPLNA